MAGSRLPMFGDQAGRFLKLDCRHYRGDRPCAVGVQGVCPTDCHDYSAMGHRVVVIKLGALGDVIRTLALLPGLKHQWPQSHITWVTRPSGVRMLANHPLIDRLLPFDAETICHLERERFDLCLSLDKEPGPAALGMRIDAADRRGIGLSGFGTVYPLNAECVDYFQLGLDDALKFDVNKDSYQRLIYNAIGLEYRQERYQLYPGQRECARAERLWNEHGLAAHEPLVGLNTGAGNVFANKSWSPEQFAEFARALIARGRHVALFGGPEEREINPRIAADCPGVIDTGCDHTELVFAALLERCSVLLTGDTMAMHAAIACEVPCVVLFGPTCSQEVDLFGRGTKLNTLATCAPCYLRTCDKSPNCMDEISLERAMQAVEQELAPAERPLPEIPVAQESAV